MAMAAVRFAARRLTGKLPQAILRSAVVNEQGVLNRGGSPAYALRRFTSSEASASKAPKICSEHASVSGESRLMAADQKKEELVGLLVEIQRNKDIPFTRRMKDRLLLQRLASHVCHKPCNPAWHWYLQEYNVISFLRGTTVFFFILYYTEKWAEFWKFVRRNKQVQGVDSNNKDSASYAKANIEE